MAEVGRLLDCAADGRGGVLAISGPRGSGRTELAAAAAREGARLGFTVLRTALIRGQQGRLAWARLLADAGAPGDLAARVLGGAREHRRGRHLGAAAGRGNAATADRPQRGRAGRHAARPGPAGPARGVA